MFEAQELCDRIAFIKGGKIIMLGTFAELQKKIKSKNSIEINCTNPEAVVSALSSLSRISVKIIGKQLLEVVVEDYSVMNKILEKLSKSTSEIFSVNVLEPTLEEAYLEIITKKSGASNA
jgi:ABC-type multidrug transport system ATPase subunit